MRRPGQLSFVSMGETRPLNYFNNAAINNRREKKYFTHQYCSFSLGKDLPFTSLIYC